MDKQTTGQIIAIGGGGFGRNPKNTAIEGRKLQGKVKLTLLKGEVVFSI